MNVRIYPAFSAKYYTYYLLGVQQIIGKRPWFSLEGFPTFGPYGLALIIENGLQSTRVYIHAGDSSHFDEEALEWCDVFAKVNIDPNLIPEEHEQKIMAIGPSFGVRTWGAILSTYLSLRSYWLLCKHGNRYVIDRPRLHFSHYRAQQQRLPLSEYEPGSPQNDYIFCVSSLWAEDKINKMRLRFMETCRAMEGVRFEGGFAPNRANLRKVNLSDYETLLLASRVSLGEFIQRTRESTAVFSTPAVHECHGWKLGEYLALGKAIVSTPLTRVLPTPLLHGEHVHFVDGTAESITQAVRLILRDPTYRNRLEHNARQYYSMYLHPKRVMERILEKIAK